MGALSGVRVLDLSRVLAGPWASQLLADFGADVIKVERPETGDDTRAWGPPWMPGGDRRRASYFASANRNKRSITIDLSRPEGRDLVLSLVDWADVLLENYKVGGLSAYGLDPASLCARNPRLVACSITGFGQDGPLAHEPGYDMLAQAMGGLMSVTGRPDGEPGGGPIKAGVALVDILTGLYASNAILAALREREISGRGQQIDLALFDVAVASMANQAMGYLATGRPPGRMGNAHPSIVPYEDFPVHDGRIMIAVGNDRQFRELAAELGAPEWAEDERFSANKARVAHREILVPAIAQRTSVRESVELLSALSARGIPASPILDLAAAFAHPQAVARGLRAAGPDGEPTVRNPVRFSRTPAEIVRGPPALGEHTEEILRDVLALTPERIAELLRDEVVG